MKPQIDQRANDDEDELRRRIAEDQKAMDLQAYEILARVHQLLLASPPIQLVDGTEVNLRNMQLPSFTREGDLTSTFDVSLPNGAFLEFSLTKTGHGRPTSHYADLIQREDRGERRGR